MKAKAKPAQAFRPSRSPKAEEYTSFDQINGTHDYRKAVRDGFIDYPARIRPGGKIVFFNFDLAKEMGLLPKSHPNTLNSKLQKKILETFSLVIVNEYDFIHARKVTQEPFKPKPYMATRYLQLQHPNKKGKTSGDGRSIWNGQFKSKGKVWDLSSCGTGVTRLCPATAIEKKFFKTGDPNASYGSGYSDSLDGISTAVMSEVFHRNGIETERTLVVIEFPGATSVNVRAASSLLRPSHFFLYLKQKDHPGLKAASDFFIQRQIENKQWKQKPSQSKYDTLAEFTAKKLGRLVAQCESDYIFVWFDWDGDNLLANGGIIDYGSVRQFGLYHHEYRYDDVDRFSTTIPEQYQKAKYIIQTYAQMAHFLKNKKKRPIQEFSSSEAVKLFEKTVKYYRKYFFLKKIGFNEKLIQTLIKYENKKVTQLRTVFHQLEKAKSSRGRYNTPDGVTWDAIFCMRDVLREYPRHLLKNNSDLPPKDFMEIMASSYAKKKDRKLTKRRLEQISKFKRFYLELMKAAAKRQRKPLQKTVLEVVMRSSLINRFDRITGESIILISEELLRASHKIKQKELYLIWKNFLQYQDLSKRTKIPFPKSIGKKGDQKFKRMIKLVRENFEGL